MARRKKTTTIVPRNTTPPVVSVSTPAVYDSVVKHLRSGGTNIRCSALKQLLESLHFQVSRAGGGNHYVITHPSIPGFRGAHYNCGHGQDPQVKPAYIRRLRIVIEENQEYLVGQRATP